MSIPFKSGVAAAATAVLLLLPTAGAHAATQPFNATGTSGADALAQFSAASPATTSITSTAQPQTLVQTQTQVAVDFLTQTINQSATPGGPSSPFDEAAQVSVFVQSAPALRNPLSVNLRGSSDLALWNLVASIKAQQSGNSFDLVDTGLAALQITAGAPVSAVPLPGAAWLFVMGILGLTGTRLTGIKSATSAAKGARRDDRAPQQGSFGSAMPA